MKRLIKKKIIYRNPGEPYLIRYTLFTCPWFSIKVHKILLSDPSCMHDHPWAFLTFLLKGGYVERTPKGSKVYSRGSLLYRPASYIHKLEIHQPVWTFVITFRKIKRWGFLTPLGWVEWYKYDYAEGCE